MDPETLKIVNTVILTLGSLGGAWLSYKGIRYGVDRARKQRRAADPDQADHDEAIARYEDDPRAFVRDLFVDNKALRETVRALEEQRRKDLDEQDKQRRADRQDLDKALREISSLRESLDNLRREDSRFRDALGRWLARIFAAWGTPGSMPWPPAEDVAILHSVLPTRSTNT